MKLLTLAIAAYNMEPCLRHCLDTVVSAQHADRLELLVINDGSKDRTSEIAHQYESRYPDIVHVVDKENGNYGSCINRALQLASGRYFRPLDADDCVDTGALDQMLVRLEQCEADLIITPYNRVADDTILSEMKLPSLIDEHKLYDARQADFSHLQVEHLVSMHSMTYRTELLRKIKLHLHEGISYSDTEYCMLPLDQIQTIQFWSLPLYQYEQGREGQTIQPQNIVSSVRSFYELSVSLSAYYRKHASSNGATVRANQRCFLRRVLYYFSTATLVFNPTAQNRALFDQLAAQISDIPEVTHDLMSFRHRGIYYVWLWQRLRLPIYKWLPC